MTVEIDIQSLRLAVNAILDHVVTDLGIRKLAVSADNDFYWEVPSDRLHAVKETQPQLDIGRLSDDMSFLTGLTADTPRMVAAMLVHAAPLLRLIGEEMGK